MILHLSHTKYAGYYRVRRFRGSLCTFDSGWFSNLITNGGLDQIANIPLGTGGVPYLITQGFVGTGDAPPQVTDTSLSTYLASSDIIEAGGADSFVSGTPPYWRHVRTFTFPTGSVTGMLQEVGVGNTKDTLFSRALIVDTLGNSSAVQVLPDEGIQLSYELRSYINAEDVLFSETFSGNVAGSDVLHSFVCRPANMNVAKSLNIGIGYSRNNIALYSGNIQGVNQIPLGSATSTTTYVNQNSYTPGTYTTSFTFTFYESTGNYVGGIPSIRVTNQQCDFQMSVTPPIMKTDRHILTLTAFMSWGRYTP